MKKTWGFKILFSNSLYRLSMQQKAELICKKSWCAIQHVLGWVLGGFLFIFPDRNIMKEEGKKKTLPNNLPSDIGCKLKELLLSVWDDERNQTWKLHAFMGKIFFCTNVPHFCFEQWSIRFLNIQVPGLSLTLIFIARFYISCADDI